MSLKKKLLEKSRLYIIVDKRASKYSSLSDVVREIKGLNYGIIQLRDKESKKEPILKEAFRIKKILLKRKIIFIINDYIDIAKIADSDGLHLGQDDIPLGIARKLLGKDKIIGISCHNLSQAIRAQDQGADYISIGPVFSTPTKPEYKEVGLKLLRTIAKNIHIPFFAIGGIDENNINRVLSSGAKRVAVARAVCQAANIAGSIKNISEKLSFNTNSHESNTN